MAKRNTYFEDEVVHKKIDIKHAFMYNNEIVKVSLFYDRLIIQIDDSGIKMSE